MGKLMTIRKVADKSGDRNDDGSWPLAGIEAIDPPDICNVPTGWVNKGMAEGWISLENPRIVIRPGGPADEPNRVLHQFIQADALTIDTLDGELRYRVTHQPDKYVADGTDEDPVTHELYAAGATRVDWFYGLEREA